MPQHRRDRQSGSTGKRNETKWNDYSAQTKLRKKRECADEWSLVSAQRISGHNNTNEEHKSLAWQAEAALHWLEAPLRVLPNKFLMWCPDPTRHPECETTWLAPPEVSGSGTDEMEWNTNGRWLLNRLVSIMLYCTLVILNSRKRGQRGTMIRLRFGWTSTPPPPDTPIQSPGVVSQIRRSAKGRGRRSALDNSCQLTRAKQSRPPRRRGRGSGRRAERSWAVQVEERVIYHWFAIICTSARVRIRISRRRWDIRTCNVRIERDTGSRSVHIAKAGGQWRKDQSSRVEWGSSWGPSRLQWANILYEEIYHTIWVIYWLTFGRSARCDITSTTHSEMKRNERDGYS